jgi:hypothetical protein
MLKLLMSGAAGLAIAAAATAPAFSAETPASDTVAAATLRWTNDPATPQAPSADAAAPSAPATAAVPADDKALADISGRGETVASAMTDQSLSAVNTGNTINATSLVSGAISLTDSALSGFSGVGNFLMNTGANNNLQSTMSVTVVITQ